MTNWNDVARELNETKTPDGKPDLDRVRRSKMRAVSEYTGRPLIVYASDFLGKGREAADLSINFNDKDGFSEVASTLSSEEVDVLIHSPGGSAEATESIVRLLRSQFKHVRFIVPQIAKSAATMLVLSGDEILMDTGAELGPIDPQFNLPRGDGATIVAPAQAILDQHEEIVKRIKADPRLLPAYIPILQFFAPSLEMQARNAIDLSKSLVREWLKAHMFRERKARDRIRLASGVARYLGSHNKFKSHAKGIYLDDFRKVKQLKAVKVLDLGEEPGLQSLIRGLHHAIGLTFGMSTAIKIFENSEGRAMIRHVRQMQIQIPAGIQQLPTPER